VLIAVGGAANLLAIVANAGVMPTSAWAQRAAGLQPTDVFANSAVRDHPHLLWFGDVIPVPLPLGLSNVLSVGDLLIYAGALVFLHRVCVRTIAPAPWSLAPGLPQTSSQTATRR
jgi:hypothetical protein